MMTLLQIISIVILILIFMIIVGRRLRRQHRAELLRSSPVFDDPRSWSQPKPQTETRGQFRA